MLAKHALKFLDQRPIEKPFFMMIGTPAPHTPATPAERHKNKFKGVKAVRSPAFNHSGFDVSIKSILEKVLYFSRIPSVSIYGFI